MLELREGYMAASENPTHVGLSYLARVLKLEKLVSYAYMLTTMYTPDNVLNKACTKEHYLTADSIVSAF